MSSKPIPSVGGLVMWMVVLVVLILFGAFLWRNRSSLYLAAAHRAHHKGNTEAMLHSFAKAEKAGRLGAAPTASYAFFLLKEGEVDAAETLLERALNQGRKKKQIVGKDRNLVESYWALVLWKRGRLAEAAEVLERLLAEGYRTTSVYGSLGYMLIELKQWDRAEAVCLEANDWDPQGKVIRDNWGSYLLARERWDEARKVYDELVDLNPQFPEAWYGAGVAALKTGDREEALRRWLRALDLRFSALTTISRETVTEALAKLQLSISDQRE